MKRGVVIVGSGLIARFHAQAVLASSRCELKGFCNPHSLGHAQKIAAEFGGAAWNDLDAALAVFSRILPDTSGERSDVEAFFRRLRTPADA